MSAFRGLSDFELKLPDIPESAEELLKCDDLFFRKIMTWMGLPSGSGNATETVLNAFRRRLPEVPSYMAMVENLRDAFSRIDLGGYANPYEEDFAEDWFAVSFESSAEPVFVSKDGSLPKGLREVLLWVNRYSLVPVFDFAYAEKEFDLLYSEDHRPEFNGMYPDSLRNLRGTPNPYKLPWRMDNSLFYDLKNSFERYQELQKEWDSVRMDVPFGALPKYVIRTIDERECDRHDPMRDAWDRIVEEREQECSVYFGFFQIGVNMKTADPKVFPDLLSETVRNLSALEGIMLRLGH